MMREQIVQVLEDMQSRGEFDGRPEENVNFDSFSDEELEWYRDLYLEVID